MDRILSWTDSRGSSEEQKRSDLETRVLRNKLVNLTLDWELAALALDAQRYKTSGPLERESLRDSANTYRKCVAELSGLLSNSSVLACKVH
jgi:hypothetical protein